MWQTCTCTNTTEQNGWCRGTCMNVVYYTNCTFPLVLVTAMLWWLGVRAMWDVGWNTQHVPLSPKLEQCGTRAEIHSACLSVPSRSNVGRTLKHTAHASQSQVGAMWVAHWNTQHVPLSPNSEQYGMQAETHNMYLSVPSWNNVGHMLKHIARASRSQVEAMWDALWNT